MLGSGNVFQLIYFLNRQVLSVMYDIQTFAHSI